jgi:hypothetical protein
MLHQVNTPLELSDFNQNNKVIHSIGPIPILLLFLSKASLGKGLVIPSASIFSPGTQ